MSMKFETDNMDNLQISLLLLPIIEAENSDSLTRLSPKKIRNYSMAIHNIKYVLMSLEGSHNILQRITEVQKVKWMCVKMLTLMQTE